MLNSGLVPVLVLLSMVHSTYQLSICSEHPIEKCDFRVQYRNDACSCSQCTSELSSCLDSVVMNENSKEFYNSLCQKWKSENSCTDLFIPISTANKPGLTTSAESPVVTTVTVTTTPTTTTGTTAATNSNTVIEKPSIQSADVAASPMVLLVAILATLALCSFALIGFVVVKISRQNTNTRDAIQLNLLASSASQMGSNVRATVSFVDETEASTNSIHEDQVDQDEEATNQPLLPTAPPLARSDNDTISVNQYPQSPADFSVATGQPVQQLPAVAEGEEATERQPSDSSSPSSTTGPKVESERLVRAEETNRPIRYPDTPQTPEVLHV
ncbi:hypothetical protein BOX15_Mlig030166g1 [Macrostomum lignano]|uniref:TNFR-Cys domain-containing protein n=1 Tax=Macrostomum lignano TaxID=282301 RepID=A0A267FTL0_9PLAT|nr:hypothetical protein BOX15_Mlig013425g1 [Macrostomum lignano]PAA90434.1 hypothetical protein BOX15_Mlig030166g1 [Macrostomum lignano]